MKPPEVVNGYLVCKACNGTGLDRHESGLATHCETCKGNKVLLTNKPLILFDFTRTDRGSFNDFYIGTAHLR